MSELLIHDPLQQPSQGVHSGLHPSMIGPSKYEINENLYSDKGPFECRGGTSLVFALPQSLTGASLVDLWSGSLDGVVYKVFAYALNSKIELWVSENWGTMYRLSQVGGWHGASAGASPPDTAYGNAGDTRFPTVTDRVVFTPIRTQRGFVAGVVLPSRDSLVISNGFDPCLVWTPSLAVASTISITGAADDEGVLQITAAAHGMDDGDTVVISGVGGNTAANGSFWVKRTGANTFKLYYDEALSSAVVSSGAYTSGGSFTRSHRLALHKQVSVPARARDCRAIAGFSRFWQVAEEHGVGTDKTYATGGVLNQARFRLRPGNVAPYAANENQCVEFSFDAATITRDDIATVQFPTSLTLKDGIVFVIEPISKDGETFDLFPNAKFEINPDNAVYAAITSPWVTIYDPESTDPQLSTHPNVYLMNDGVDTSTVSTLSRFMVRYKTTHIADADKTAFHIRFTWKHDTAPLVGLAYYNILAIASEGDIPGGSEFTISYSGRRSQTESAGIVVASGGGARLSQIGGPPQISPPEDVGVPVLPDVKYDYTLILANSEGSTPREGGLDNLPADINVYLRVPDAQSGLLEPTAWYFYSVGLWADGVFAAPFIGLGWLKVSSADMITHATDTVTNTYSVDARHRDFNRAAPGPYQIAIPPHRAAVFANNRLFVGDIYNAASSARERGDLYMSGWNAPFRFQSVVTDSRSGGRNQYAGEQIMALDATGAASQGASFVFLITDSRFKVLGGSGPSGSGFDTEELSQAFDLSDRGTLAPRSFVVHNGSAYWLDDYGSIQSYVSGQPRNLSRTSVFDKFESIPAGRTDDVTAVPWKDRILFAYTPSGESANTRVAVWNTVLGIWECDIVPPSPALAERMVVARDTASAGAGKRLLFGAANGSVYETDKAGATDLGAEIAVRLRTGDIASLASFESVSVDSVTIEGDPLAKTWTISRIGRSPASEYSTEIDMTSGFATDDSSLHDEDVQPNDDEGSRAKSVQLQIAGGMTAGKRIIRIWATIDRVDSVDAEG